MSNNLISNSNFPPSAPYNSFKNPNFLPGNSISTTYYTLDATGRAVSNIRWTDPSTQPQNNLFTIFPNYPLQPGASSDEIRRLQESKAIYNSITNTNTNISTLNGSGNALKLPFKTFKSDQDRIKYMQALHSFRYGYAPSTSFFYQ